MILDESLPISRTGIFAVRVALVSRTPRIPALAPYPGEYKRDGVYCETTVEML